MRRPQPRDAARRGGPPWTGRSSDPLAEKLDVVAVNEYFGWYYCGGLAKLTPIPAQHARRVMLENLDRIRIDTRTTKPLIVSEFGADARLGRRAPATDPAVFSEDYQALVYERQIAMLRRQPHLVGVSPWVLKDFRSPLRMDQGMQAYFNRKGLVSEDGAPKLAFEVLREFYREIEAAGGLAAEPPAAPRRG